MATLNSNLSQNSDENIKINNIISELTQQLRKEYAVTQLSDARNSEDIKNTILSKIENIMYKLVRDIGERKRLSISMDKISWENCVYDNKICLKPSTNCKKTEIKLNITSFHKFSIICFLLGKIYILLKTNETCNKRELYYRNVEVLQSQSAVDNALNDVTNLLGVSLYELNIHTTSKGLIFGQVLITTPNEEINCSSVGGGTLIPNNVYDITEIKSDAKFVLLLEKDTIFQRLLDDEALNNIPPCILITAKGFPDINTRVLLKKIWDLLSIPILALVDPDPWGIEIMCIYRFGSLAMSRNGDRLAVPSIRWLGVYPSELTELSEVRAPLTPKDKNKIKDLLGRPYTRSIPALQYELENIALKAEVENIDTPQGYLAHKYIPCKISAGNFI